MAKTPLGRTRCHYVSADGDEHVTTIDEVRSTIDNEYGGVFASAYEWIVDSPGLRPCGPLTWQPP